jgi:hypothetical protein
VLTIVIVFLNIFICFQYLSVFEFFCLMHVLVVVLQSGEVVEVQSAGEVVRRIPVTRRSNWRRNFALTVTSRDGGA